MATASRSFSANYRRYTPQATDLLMRISAALGTIGGARILPAVADQLRASAKAGTVHYSNLIEGNQLPFVEAERAARGELAPDTRAKIELVNYVAALDLIDERLADGRWTSRRRSSKNSTAPQCGDSAEPTIHTSSRITRGAGVMGWPSLLTA